MDIIEIIPPKQLNFCLPTDLQRVLTLTNQTLHSVYVLILKSHYYEISLSSQSFLMQAFQQKKVDITINWAQEAHNWSLGKLRICYEEIEDEMTQAEMTAAIMKTSAKSYFEDLSICVHLDTKSSDLLNYKIVQKQGETSYEPKSIQLLKKYYLMERISHTLSPPSIQKAINNNQLLHNEILSFLQNISEIISINPCEQNASFLIQFTQTKEDACQIVEFLIELDRYVYSIKRLVSYGGSQEMPAIVNLEGNGEIRKHQNKGNTVTNIHQKDIIRNASPPPIVKQTSKVDSPTKQLPQKQKKQHLKKDLIKQSFVGRKEVERPKQKRRNKSQEKIIENISDQEDEGELLKEQIRQLRLMEIEQLKNARKGIGEEVMREQRQKTKEVKVSETNMEFTQKVLNVLIEKKEYSTEVYVLLRDCVRCFILEEPLAKKIIKFDPIYEENINLPCPIDIYKDELIFGNQTCLFWVHVQTGQSEWKYVQRKYIYTIAVIEELSLAAVGGKNFSKLSYFGKQTFRSNIKLYSCSSSDKHEHLFTYDIPGNNTGNVMNMAYISAPPHGTKLLLVHTLSGSSNSAFHFLRVKAFNKIELYGQIDLDELGILNLLKFKYNRESARIVCMEALGQTEMDTFKKLKVKCQYEKVEVSTEGIKLPLKRYISFHLGGNKQSKNHEWMSLVDENGSLIHLYDIEESHMESLILGKGQIRQVISVNNEQFLLICTETSIRIRQKVEMESQK